jgi:hypothetical protein
MSGVCVQRDPFARASLYRRIHGFGECSWCGQKRRYLYSYTWYPDGLRPPPEPDKERFCNLSCHGMFYI